jgi:hypothetical protein
MNKKKSFTNEKCAVSQKELSKKEGIGMSRRKFIASTAAASVFTVIPKNVLGMRFGAVAPGDKITMAQIGCGTQGHNEIGPLINCPDLQFVAVADPETDGRNYLDFQMNSGTPAYPFRVINNIRGLLGKPDWRAGINYVPGGRMVMKEVIETFYANKRAADKFPSVTPYNDFRELLDKEDIDAVKIMTPDHLHATIAIAAMKKGKHVIVHKPLANRITESNLVIETARQTGVATYFMPYNSYQSVEPIKAMIDDGVIGTLREIHNWVNQPVWPQWLELPTDTPPVPKGFDWDMWLGPAAYRPYHPNYTHNVFRGWFDFGLGSMADVGHYSLWTVCDGFDLDVPAFVEAYGAHACRVANGNTAIGIYNDYSYPLASNMRFHFAAKKGSRPALDLFWYDGGMRPPSIPELDEDNKSVSTGGLMFVGDKGKILDGRLIPESRMKTYMGDKYTEAVVRSRAPVAATSGTPVLTAIPSTGTYTIGALPPQFDKWIAACRGGDKNTPANFISAKPLSTMINLGTVALRAGRRIVYDPVKVELTNYPEGNKLLTREYRKGWEL